MKQKLIQKILYAVVFGVLLFKAHSSFGQASGVSISWDREVGCQTYFTQEGDRKIYLENIAADQCLNVCEKSVVTYSLSGELGPEPNTQWVITGGTVITSTSTNCVVQWGAAGNGGITIVLSTPNGVINKTLCIERIIIPKASFNVNTVTGYVFNPDIPDAPQPPRPSEIYACANQTIYFENASTVNNGSELVSYFWDFGDGSSSTAFEPSHFYTEEGAYEVSLTVYNKCNCSAKFRRMVYVKSGGGFDIQCPGVVCEGETVTYSLPFDGKTICKDKYVWNSAGTIDQPIVNEQNGDATVTWNNIGTDGFGYLTFVPTECELKCLLPTTIKIPVITTRGTIHGDTSICAKSQAIYSLPQWPSTEFHWSILEDPTETNVTMILNDQRNQVILFPQQPGIYTLLVTYENTLLHCGGTARLEIKVNEPVEFEGPTLLCQNSTASYHTSNGQQTTWILKNSNGATVGVSNPSPAESFSYTFTTPGNYSLSVGASGTCPAQQKNISVLPLPAPPTAPAITVLDPESLADDPYVPAATLAVCPNAPYSYKASDNPLIQYRWTVTNGTIEGAVNGVAFGNEVIISFNGATPAVINVSTQSITPIPCTSAPLSITVPIKEINAQINDNLPDTVCANTYKTYWANFTNTNSTYNQGESYSWRIEDPALGSITEGQDGNTGAKILWNNVTVATTTNLLLTITKCTLSVTISIPVTITPVPKIILSASPTTVCSGEDIYFTVKDEATNQPITTGSATWNYGGGNTSASLSNNHYAYSNTTVANVGHVVKVFITNPNGCVGTTNTASVAVTVLPGPPAAASLSTEANAFCLQSAIAATLTVASSIDPSNTYQWYNGSTLLTGQTGTTLTITPAMGFGNYYFTVTNSLQCKTNSNAIIIRQHCDEEACIYEGSHEITNSSAYDCGQNGGFINLVGTASGNSDHIDWTIVGPPNVNLTGYTGTTFIPSKPGEFHTYCVGYYLNAEGEFCPFAEPKTVLVPYIPDVAYNAVCNGNNSFNVTLVDKTSFFALVTSPTITYEYRLGNTGSWTTVSGSTINNLAAGTYQIKVIANGEYPANTAQPTCQRIINMALTTLPDQNITVTPNPVNCHDTAVTFKLDLPSISTSSYLWTFEPGAQSTLYETQRVFSSDGNKTVTVAITNAIGCVLNKSVTVTIPKKCFNGTVTSAPENPRVCTGTPVTLSYQPGTTAPNIDDCNPLTYTWMNGQTPVPLVGNTPTITVTKPGFYWVKVAKNDCKYDTPNRIMPVFYPLPSVKLDGPTVVCDSDAFTVHATANTTQLNWSILYDQENRPLPTYQDNPYLQLSGLAAGNYTVMATAISSQGCRASVSQMVTVKSSPPAPVISQEVICPGQVESLPYYHINLSATSEVDGQFTWSNGVSGATQTVTDGGPYQVRITVDGCSSVEQIDVPKKPDDFMWVFPSGCQTTCVREGQGTLIGPSQPVDQWTWLFNNEVLGEGTGFTPPMPVSASGTYNLVLNAGGCAFTSKPLDYVANLCEKCDIKSVDILEIGRIDGPICSFNVYIKIDSVLAGAVTLTASNNDVVVVPTSFMLNAGAHIYPFVMIPVGPNFSGGIIHLLLSTTDDDKPCTYDFTLDLPTCEGVGQTKLVSAPTHGSLVIVPNPAKTQVAVQYKDFGSAVAISIYDLTGRIVATYHTQETEGEWNIATDGYPSGVYIVVVRSKDGLVSQQKLVIE
ncbi:T9SS type A sorting domain-containing protein [Flavobacterium phycosphaerae]|uniref:T9SS type A sorting domain-containing protein n=1 Tax=Flavobacterium phycosphaerae TaxID=2697515 RepID=UPI00138A055F|nr:PKD domain-containing protein [Flavobacterium phycosphaerae]